MFDLFVASEAVQRKIGESLEPKRPTRRKPQRERPRRETVRSSSAAALRSLAERLEPSPSR
jgi:hypothetical protein